MDKFLKRKPTDDAGPDDAKKQARVRPTFVVAPGASGGDCALLSAALGTLGRTRTIAGCKWAGNFPSQMGANVALVENLVDHTKFKRRSVSPSANSTPSTPSSPTPKPPLISSSN